MRLPLLLVALLVASLGAGCLGGGGKALTAREGLGDAQASAKSWGDAPKLIGVAAIEPFKHIDHTTPDGKYHTEFVTHVDGNPGDGKAPGWLYAFVSGDRCILVALAGGLGILAEGYETCDEPDGPIDGWVIDSDQAASILQARADWPDFGENASFLWTLGAEDGIPLWTIEADTPDGLSAQGVVNAHNGTVVGVTTRTATQPLETVGPPAAPGQPGEAGSPGFTAVHDEAHAPLVTITPLTATVTLDGSGGYLTLSADVQASLGAVGTCELTLTGPEGVVDSHVFPGVGATGVYQADFSMLPAGDYVLSLHTTVGAALLPNLFLDGGWA